MNSRRCFLSTVATIGATAVAGCSGLGTPGTENKIGEVDSQTADSIQRIEFYESGAANVIPANEQGPYDEFAIVHSATELGYSGTSIDTEDALDVWEFGDFDEPVTIDLAGAISERSNYPNQTFKLRVLPEDGAVFGATSDKTMTFDVPESFMPE